MNKPSQLQIWAHRGGSENIYPENSIEAIQGSIRNGVKNIELDVWLYKGKLLLSHEEPISSKYPLLSEALLNIAGQAQIYLEIKHIQAAASVHELITKSYIEHYDTVIFASFDVEVLRLIREQSSAARIGLNYRGIDNAFIDISEDLKAEVVAFNWKRVLPNYFNIKQSREELGIKHLAYTVNNPTLLKYVKLLKIDGIFTDYPSKFNDNGNQN